MELIDIINLLDNGKIIQNGEFTSLGLAVSRCDEKLLSFIESEKYINSLGDNITCLITTEELGNKLKDNYGIIVAKNPRMEYFKLHNALSQNKEYVREIHKTVIGKGCKISKLSSIAENNVVIGNNVTIEEFVVIRENTVIGDNSIIRSGVKIGGEGYEYKRVDGKIMNVVHCGGVVIGENVEVQYNACIDKALYTWDNTIVGNYCKLDNLVHLEHGVKIDERCLIASRTTIGGRTTIGKDSWVGLGVVISNGLTLGDKVSVSLGAVVTKSLKDEEKVSGNFAIDHNKYIEFIKTIR
ncbi:UDP-3-O-(3-hydroxymyristoyl)glucosamine N-acyltransferase [Clostridium sp. NSJ-145]|uniref:UDP-3-O-(3-hydroxymyristoyl)glucosamine N-acyltransferase n=1 Tax=Clostridium sp. NSJ-145 TaxID=2897777 RepID=UPI001E43F665|nr:UDP-3-O-(3-hydroxymyristoyl)glucosamine N-acyltransferase [Clostridium sp. NSJ-145]MCD2502385.1 UDP-3-O-(3-hydroxymyristoyl)glucosamine N-acyltransferase [Clostridium sp. NSJ-145]